jgi:PPP family 3-phenylpropionic acid transporter
VRQSAAVSTLNSQLSPLSPEGLRRRFRVFYFLLYLPIGMQAPYLMLFFQRQGMTNAQLGTLAAVSPIMSFLTPPLWGVLADALGDRRRMLTILLIASGLAFPWLMWSPGFDTSLPLFVLFCAFSASPAAIADAITMENVGRMGGDYARLRLWGSVGFAVPLLAFGLLLKRGAGGSAASLHIIFIGFAVSRLLSAAWVRALPPSRNHSASRFGLRGALAFANRHFLVLALCGMLATGAMSAYYMYLSIYLDGMGIPDNMKGYFWAVAVASETGMMLVIGRVIRRLGLKWTFALGILGGAVRLFLFSLPLTPAEIACTQLLHALTLTTFMVASINLISRFTPPGLRATGQTLWVAVTTGLGATLGSKLAGAAVGAWGLQPMYRAFSLASAAGLLIAILFLREPAPEGAPAAEPAAAAVAD